MRRNLMHEALAHQLRREFLDVLHEEGGQASWHNLTMQECDVLRQMEIDGLVERVQESGRTAVAFTYRLKPRQTGQ